MRMALIMGLALWAGVPALGLDKVTRVNGDVVIGTVLRDNVKGIQMRLAASGLATMNPNEIRDVEYGNAPREYDRGHLLFKQKRYESAAQAFQQALDSRRIPKLLKQYAYYYMARSYEGAKKFSEAAKTYKTLIDTVSDSRFLPEAISNLVVVHINRKEYGPAKKLLSKMRPYDPQGAELKRAMIEERSGHLSTALGIYDRLSRRGGTIGAEASVGKARILYLQKRYDPAIEQAKKATRTEGSLPSTVFAQAHLVIGNCRYKQADRDKRPELAERALFSFLRIPLQYPGDPLTEPEAMYKLASCFNLLSDADVKKATTYRRRAKSWIRELVTRYPQSPWAAKARKN